MLIRVRLRGEGKTQGSSFIPLLNNGNAASPLELFDMIMTAFTDKRMRGNRRKYHIAVYGRIAGISDSANYGWWFVGAVSRDNGPDHIDQRCSGLWERLEDYSRKYEKLEVTSSSSSSPSSIS